jgi:hypothetical protein
MTANKYDNCNNYRERMNRARWDVPCLVTLEFTYIGQHGTSRISIETWCFGGAYLHQALPISLIFLVLCIQLFDSGAQRVFFVRFDAFVLCWSCGFARRQHVSSHLQGIDFIWFPMLRHKEFLGRTHSRIASVTLLATRRVPKLPQRQPPGTYI